MQDNCGSGNWEEQGVRSASVGLTVHRMQLMHTSYGFVTFADPSSALSVKQATDLTYLGKTVRSVARSASSSICAVLGLMPASR